MKNFSILLSLLLSAIFITTQNIDIAEYGLSASSPWQNRFLYMFFHGNVIHLLINIYTMLTLVFLCSVTLRDVAIGAFIALAIPSCILIDAPMVGISTMIYSITGIISMRSDSWLKLFAINIALIAFQFAMPHIAVLAHLCCFLVGTFVGFFTIKRYEY